MEEDPEQHRLYPKVEEAVCYECMLEPGDVLYTPPLWWHHVESCDDSISVLVPFDPLPQEIQHLM